jgi:hypothetical protein
VARVVLILLAAGVLLALIEAVLRLARRRLAQRHRVSGVAAFGLASALSGVMAAYPLLFTFPTGGYLEGSDQALYQFFARQPAAIHVASLADEASNLPLLCRRSNLIGAECAVPFHPGYYLPLRRRGLQIAHAQYSADPAIVQQCVRDQQIDFWLLDRAAFSHTYWHRNRLLRQLRPSAPGEALGESHGATPFLQRPPPQSIAFQDAHFIVLDAHRLFSRD